MMCSFPYLPMSKHVCMLHLSEDIEIGLFILITFILEQVCARPCRSHNVHGCKPRGEACRTE